MMAARTPFIGTAGWSLPAAHAGAFPAEGSQLQRYAAVLSGVEINTSFYRPHRPQTYERWAASTPAGFRFAVKCPRQITHDARLDGADEALARFVGEAGALGGKWAVMLVQLPPSLRLDAPVAARFFARVRAAYGGAVVCEPRHASWFTAEAERLLRDAGVARVAADPARWPGAELPGGDPSVAYFRWHGSPRIYRSDYGEAWLQQRAHALKALPKGTARWCIFDNTASGAALGNAIQLRALW
jgi:uncharacterized protein YecE (DUF72 family)